MNPLLIADVRAGTLKEAHDIFATQRLQAEGQIHKHDGAAAALKTAIGRVQGLHAVLDGMREKELSEMETEDQIRAAKFAKHWLDQAVQILEKLYAGEEQAKIRTVGKAQALGETVKSLETMHTAVRARQHALQEAIEKGDVEIENGELVHTGDGRRTPGTRPGKSIAQQRREEDGNASSPESASAPAQDEIQHAPRPVQAPDAASRTPRRKPVKRRASKAAEKT